MTAHQTNTAHRVNIPNDMVDYCALLTWRRKADSESEAEFIAKLIDPYIPNLSIGPEGNRYGEVFNPDGSRASRLWSCHLDTMHQHSGRQRISYDPARDEIFLSDKTSNCLGADDASGIWLLFQMMRAGVPGLYAFHRGEERGGIGSDAAVDDEPKRFAHISHAIAFDRRGKTDVVYSQMAGLCGSTECAAAIADLLNGKIKFPTAFAPSDLGSFTDTANYARIVPECFNISVGYEGEHSPRELQHLGYLRALRDAVIAIDWSTMPVIRKAGDFGESLTERYARLYGAYDDDRGYPNWQHRIPTSRNGMPPSLDEVRLARAARLAHIQEEAEDDILEEPMDDFSLEQLVLESPTEAYSLLAYLNPSWLDLVNANPDHKTMTRDYFLTQLADQAEDAGEPARTSPRQFDPYSIDGELGDDDEEDVLDAFRKAASTHGR